MEFVPLPNTVKVQLLFTLDGQQCQNVFHVHTPNAINEDELDSVHTLFKTWYETYLKDLQTSEVSHRGMIISDASNQFGVSKEYGPGTVFQGGVNSAPALPNNVTVSVKWNTGLRGRSYRGRTYHIGLWEASVTNNSVVSSVLTGLTSGYEALLGILDIENRYLVVASKFQGNAPRTTGVTTQVLTVTCDGIIDSQRRRLPGRGK